MMLEAEFRKTLQACLLRQVQVSQHQVCRRPVAVAALQAVTHYDTSCALLHVPVPVPHWSFSWWRPQQTSHSAQTQ